MSIEHYALKTMFNYICGRVAEKTESTVIVENNGIGWEIMTTANTLFNLTAGGEVKLFTYLQLREDGAALFGFLTREEKEMFLKLIAVSGIGPKLAVTVLSGISAKDLAVAVVSGDTAALNRIKGVGKKTAERIVLELKEKVADDVKDALAAGGGISDEPSDIGGLKSDAVLALAALGFGKFEALKAVNAVVKQGMKLEEVVAAALKKMF